MATYNYAPCANESCERPKEPFQFKRPMSEYQDPAPCPSCGEMCERVSNDFCQNFQLKGHGWYKSNYHGPSNGAVGSK